MGNQQYSFFFSDIVGYSKMVERDEPMAHRMLKVHNKIVDKDVGEVAFQLIRFP